MPRRTSIEIEKLAKGAFASVQMVPAEGYKWITEDGERFLTQGEPTWLPGADYEFAEPAMSAGAKDYPDLHRRFASLPQTEEAIKDFACEYGRLWGRTGLLESIGEVQAVALEERESFDEWCYEINEMKGLLDLWDLARKKQTGMLRDLVVWTMSPTNVRVKGELFASEGKPLQPIHTLPERRRLREATEPLRAGLLKLLKHGDVVTPARLYVVAKVNERLKGHMNPVINPFIDASTGGEIFFYPDSLLIALYVLFALEIIDYGYTETCIRCHKLFRTTNSRKHYCSDECKKANWEANGKRKRPPKTGAANVSRSKSGSSSAKPKAVVPPHKPNNGHEDGKR